MQTQSQIIRIHKFVFYITYITMENITKIYRVVSVLQLPFLSYLQYTRYYSARPLNHFYNILLFTDY